MSVKGLEAPHVSIDFKPSPKQLELWELLMPDHCPHCKKGHIFQKETGTDSKGNPMYTPCCDHCGSTELPQLILGGGSAGGGKGEALDAPICTPFGFRKLGDLKVGSIITDPITGGMQRIEALHPIALYPFYRVHFVDKTYVDCTEKHLWQCHEAGKKTKKNKKYGIGTSHNWTAQHLWQWYQDKKKGMYKGRHQIIPLTAPVNFTMGCHKPKVNPYILGAIIGDGCISDCVISRGYICFSTTDKEIEDKFIANGYDMTHWNQDLNRSECKHYSISDSTLLSELKRLGIAGNKSADHFIPREYLMASIDERIQLMQGLIDTDGYVDARGHIVYTTISEQLAEDVAFVVRSLGGVATISKGKSGYRKDGIYKQCSDHYDVQIRTKMNPDLCGLTRKKERARYDFNGGASELGKRIVDVEYIGEREGRCITVDSPHGLYITNDFTVTHNSYLGSAWVVLSCMQFPDIRAVVARKTLKSLKGSTFNTIKKILKEWGLVEGTNFKINNLEGILTFWNGSVIILQEMADLPSDPDFERFGSSEYTIAFVDEVSEISEKAVEVLFSRLRWRTDTTFKTARMLLTTNPCATWVRSRFVQDDDGNRVKCRPNEFYLPFTLFDNPDVSFRQTYLSALNRMTNKAARARLLEGNWDYIDVNDAAAYYNFNGDIHLADMLKERVYNPLKPLILSFDFNVAPYMSCLAIQVDFDNKQFYVLDEILGTPENKEANTPCFADKIANKYREEKLLGGLVVTGDPAGLSRSTMTKDGVNNFTIIMEKLKKRFRADLRLLPTQPAQVTRLDFINNILAERTDWHILIDMRCRRLVEDFTYQKRNPDGTKEKKRYTDPKTGLRCERYGHLSDCFDYAICLMLKTDWDKFRNPKYQGRVTTVNDFPVYGDFEY